MNFEKNNITIPTDTGFSTKVSIDGEKGTTYIRKLYEI